MVNTKQISLYIVTFFWLNYNSLNKKQVYPKQRKDKFRDKSVEFATASASHYIIYEYYIKSKL